MTSQESWPPHITVAVVVEQDGRFLMVEEHDELAGGLVFNQPAGHVELGERLLEAAVRETLEETGWQVELTGLVMEARDAIDEDDVDRHTAVVAQVLALSRRLRPTPIIRVSPRAAAAASAVIPRRSAPA